MSLRVKMSDVPFSSSNVVSNAVSSVLLRVGLSAVTAGTVGLLQNVLNQVLNNPGKPINWRQAEAAAIITAVTAGIFTGYAGDTYDGGTLEDEDAKKLFDLTTAVASEFVGVTGLGLYNTLVKWHQQGII